MKLLVIIVTYNAMQWAERCFNSLQNSSIVPDVFVVDNGSTDGTQAYVQEHYPEVLFHQSNENLGFGRANNLGLQYALDKGYDYVYLLNQDAWVMPDTFEKLIRVSARHPEYGVLSPIQMDASMKHIERGFANSVLGEHQKTYPLLIEDLYLERKEDVYDVTFVMAAHWFITRSCIEKSGGFSPTFPHYGEDNNYLDRIYYWKYKCGIVPRAKAVHDRSDSQWSKSKWNYIMYYIEPLILVSNPNKKPTFAYVIFKTLFKLFLRHDYSAIKYIFRFLKESGNINKNNRLSTKQKAFLQ